MRVALIILCFFVRSFAGESNALPLFKLADVLPDGPSEIELMTIRLTDRANELMLKSQAAIATNQDWYLEHVKRAKPGKPLDYDPRLGLTKEEYAESLQEIKNRQLASTGTRLPCVFQRRGETLSIDIGNTNTPLSKIRLNTTTGELFASVGRVGTPTWKTGDNPTSPIGAYEECSWEYVKNDLNTFDERIVKLQIWRLKPSGKILWRFRDSEIVHKQNKQSFDLAFQHSPKSIQIDSAATEELSIHSETNGTSATSESRR
ncbi:MAG TPA: hypothetical protein PKA41_12535 [Verrucomicrobiota bacterium]|nr:hypothetical protein [Verrucomicrobiota bacterium]